MSKFFPFTGGGVVPLRKFFFWSEHVSSQIWCQKFFPLLGGWSLCENFFTGSGRPPPSKAGLGPPPSKAELGPPLIQGWIGYPPRPRLDQVPPPSVQGWIGYPPPLPIEVWTDKLKTVPSPILRMRAVKIWL